MEIRVGRKGKSVRVRFPDNVLAGVTSAARKSGRSRNTEIVFRLAQSMGLLEAEVGKAGGRR